MNIKSLNVNIYIIEDKNYTVIKHLLSTIEKVHVSKLWENEAC